MNNISQDELKTILESYGVSNVNFDGVKKVTPDSRMYIFSGNNGKKYALYAADYLGGYESLKLPCNLKFDEKYPYDKLSICVIKIFSYKADAKNKALGYIDDNHYWTKASTGDVCTLFGISDIEFYA